jgi:uncharacterized protein YggE
MNKKRNIIVLLLWLCVQTATGQVTADDKRYIEVTGRAEMEIAPDEIMLDLIISERYDGREKITIESQEDSLKAALKKIGIDLKNLSLVYANARYIRTKKSYKDVLASEHLKLKLSDAASVAMVFEQLDQLGLSNAYISSMGLSKMDNLKKEMRIKAISAAKSKAEYLLAALGSSLGKPIFVQEEHEPVRMDAQANGMMNANYKQLIIDDAGIDKAVGSDIQLQTLKVQSAIVVRFLIQ